MSRLTASIHHVDGRVTPIGPAEPADSIGQGITYSGGMPGGQRTATLTVARDPSLRDLDPYDELVIRNAGNKEVWGGYGVEYPARDGEGPQVEISATGWASSLKDNPPPPLLGVDRRAEMWETATLARQAGARPVVANYNDAISVDNNDGLVFTGVSGQTLPQFSFAELIYRAPRGVLIGRFDYRGSQDNITGIDAPALNWANNEIQTADAGSAPVTLDDTVRTVIVPGRQFLRLTARANAASTPAAGDAFQRRYTHLAAYGDHGIPLYDNGIDGMRGVLASDVIAWGMAHTCLSLQADIAPTSFVIPHFVEPDLDSMEELVLRANATEIYDWGCFGKRFLYRPPRSGRTWVVRASDPGITLNEAGDQGEDTYTRAIVSFGDPAGKSLRVGYPGSGADVETPLLLDTSPNALNRRGRHRTLKLSLTATAVAEKAIQVGQVGLRERARLNQRGDATLTGDAQDSLLVTRSVSEIQPGDQIIFADRGWTPRQIVEQSYQEDTDVCSVSLDSTPAKLDALMERMGVINESTGI